MVTQKSEFVLLKNKKYLKCLGGGIGRHAGLKVNLSAPAETPEVELFKFGETFIA